MRVEESTMRLVHLSDIHAAESHFLPELAESVIETINAIEPEIVVITGDLTENGYSFEFEQAQRYVERIACAQKVVIPGNHDARNVGYLGFEDSFNLIEIGVEQGTIKIYRLYSKGGQELVLEKRRGKH